jgi:hypothetical protein
VRSFAFRHSPYYQRFGWYVDALIRRMTDEQLEKFNRILPEYDDAQTRIRVARKYLLTACAVGSGSAISGYLGFVLLLWRLIQLGEQGSIGDLYSRYVAWGFSPDVLQMLARLQGVVIGS